ncbi:MAG TPA: hypothetical protein VF723_17390 [Pyrinomonadaceae bacterium]|jgi:hypothetical protein
MIINRVGCPVRGDDFYGRDAFIRMVREKLEAGHVLLVSPRRFGKTSVMYRLIDEPWEDFVLVHADLEHLVEPADLIALLVVQLAKDARLSKTATGLSYFPKPLWSRFRETFEEIDLLKLRIKLREKLRTRWQEDGEELFERVAAAPHQVIFILDEFPMMIDRMAQSDAGRQEAKIMLRWLRKLRQSPDLKNVRFLVAGSIGIGQVLNALGEIASINDFEQLWLEPFPQEVAMAFLDELARTHKLPLSRPSKRKMLELIGTAVPYFVQIIFSEVAKAHMQDGRAMTPGRVEQLYREKVLGVDCKTYFDHYYGRLRNHGPQDEKALKRLLRELAVTGWLTRDACYQLYRQETRSRGEMEKFNCLMSFLENDFYVRFDAVTRRYEFASKLLRDWWLRHYGMETK